MEIIVKCRVRHELLHYVIYYAVGIFFASIVFVFGLLKFNFLYTLIGLIWLLFYIRYILTWGKSIEFYEDHIVINTLVKQIRIEYNNLETVKFVWAGFYIQDVVTLNLKKTIFTRKIFSFDVSNDKNKLLLILNHCRKKKVSTGLNKIGDKYMKFDREKNVYVLNDKYA